MSSSGVIYIVYNLEYTKEEKELFIVSEDIKNKIKNTLYLSR